MNSKILFLLLVLSASVFATHAAWDYLSDDSIKYLMPYNQNFVAVGNKGNVYSIQLDNGKKLWQVSTSADLVEPKVFQGDILVASSDGVFRRISKSGNVVWTTNAMQNDKSFVVFGIETSQDYAFATTNQGVLRLTGNGNASLVYARNVSVATPPAILNDQIIFGADDTLIVLRNQNVVKWTKKVDTFWTSRPVIWNNNIYIGALDDTLHVIGINDQYESWTYETRGWILTDALLGDNIYLTSNDGVLYSLDYSGKLKWSSITGEGIRTNPHLGFVSSKKVVFVGSDYLYAISVVSGQILWIYAPKAKINDFIYLESGNVRYVLVAMDDKKLSAFKVERTCTIEYPLKMDVLGQKEVKARGSVISNYGNVRVNLNVNGGALPDATISGDEWEFNLDPANLRSGVNSISCTVSDLAGEETIDEVFIKRDTTLPKGRFVVSAPTKALVDQKVTIFVSDYDDKSAVQDFNVKFGALNNIYSKNFTLSFPSEEQNSLTISKTGYQDYVFTIEVLSQSNPQSALLPIGVGIIVLILLYVIVTRFVFKKK
ncbi:MAG: PQQ-binding-like beta-propeller repeat protein [Candidatus Micrarchaeota archaeon]